MDRINQELMTEFGIAQPTKLRQDIRRTFFEIYDATIEIGSFDVWTSNDGNAYAGAGYNR